MIQEITRWADALSDSEKRKIYEAYVDTWEAKIGAFLQFDTELGLSLPRGNGSLSGIPFAVKDNIAVESFRLTCGSKILESFEVPYTATAVARLMEHGAIPVGKTNLDEFGMGSSTDNSSLKKTSNPYDTKRVAGGSSGGSAAAVAAGIVPFALGSDTGGSVRQPASFCGVYGLKPTYGSVSRYGLVAYASSLEVIGICAQSISVLKTVFEIMRGEDPLDHSSLPYPAYHAEGLQAKRVAVLDDIAGLDEPVKAAYERSIAALKSTGYSLVPVTIPSLEYVLPAYYTIATAEASANLARYTGVAYGRRTDWAENPEELIRKSRTEGLGDEVKLRILLGTYVLRSGFQDQYYIRAQKIRTAMRKDFERVFAASDLLLLPVFPTLAFPHGNDGMDQFQQKMADRFTCTANLAGLPALAFPTGLENGLPTGMQFLAPPFCEERLFMAAERMRHIFPEIHPEGYREEWR